MTTLPNIHIPPEVLKLCLKQLPLEDVVKARQVCKQWKELADEVINDRAKDIIGGNSPEELTKFKQLCQDVKAIQGMKERSFEERLQVIADGDVTLGIKDFKLSISEVAAANGVLHRVYPPGSDPALDQFNNEFWKFLFELTGKTDYDS